MSAGTSEPRSIDDVAPGATSWTTGRVVTLEHPTSDTVRLQVLVDQRQRHWPGQHYVIRLRAPDDYTAQRSYSVASDDDEPLVEFLVERLPDGEVSEFLAEVAEVGDVLELRGPIGRWFRWDTRTPALCLVGGTGVVPAVAMVRTARRVGRADLLRVVAVGREPGALPYAAELTRAGALVVTTRATGADGRPAGPLTTAELAPLAADAAVVFVCGSSRFVEFATALVIECGTDPATIRVEQFGATS